MINETPLTPEQQAAQELEFLDGVKSVDELSAGVTAREATARKTKFITAFGFDRWQRLCMSSSKSYGVKR